MDNWSQTLSTLRSSLRSRQFLIPIFFWCHGGPAIRYLHYLLPRLDSNRAPLPGAPCCHAVVHESRVIEYGHRTSACSGGGYLNAIFEVKAPREALVGKICSDFFLRCARKPLEI